MPNIETEAIPNAISKNVEVRITSEKKRSIFAQTAIVPPSGPLCERGSVEEAGDDIYPHLARKAAIGPISTIMIPYFAKKPVKQRQIGPISTVIWHQKLRLAQSRPFSFPTSPRNLLRQIGPISTVIWHRKLRLAQSRLL